MTSFNNFFPWYFFFFVHKSNSCSFIKLRLNHWWHIDYFIDYRFTFLGLEHCSCVAVYAVKKLSDFIKNTLICVPKMNEGLTGLEQHEGKYLILIFGWTSPLRTMAFHVKIYIGSELNSNKMLKIFRHDWENCWQIKKRCSIYLKKNSLRNCFHK